MAAVAAAISVRHEPLSAVGSDDELDVCHSEGHPLVDQNVIALFLQMMMTMMMVVVVVMMMMVVAVVMKMMMMVVVVVMMMMI